MAHDIIGPTRLRDLPDVFAHVNAVAAALKGQGIVPNDKAPFDPGEFVLVINGVTRELYQDAKLSPVAFLVFYECDAGILWVNLIHTAPASRRKGLACALLRRLGELAAEQAMRKIMLGTFQDNDAMRKLGQRAGFLTDHVVMAKAVAQPGVGLA